MHLSNQQMSKTHFFFLTNSEAQDNFLFMQILQTDYWSKSFFGTKKMFKKIWAF